MTPGRAVGRSRWIRRLAFAAGLLMLGTVAAVFIGYRHLAPTPETVVEALPEKASLTMGKITHSATRDGRVEWRLEAESARLMEGKKRLELESPRVVYFMTDGRQVHMEADRGLLDTEKNDMAAFGRVRAQDGRYRLETEELRYDHAQQRITCPVPVRIVRRRSQATGDSMVYDMNRRRMELKGHVEVRLDKKARI